MACKLYIRMKMRGVTVEEQIQWVLLYVQGGSADVQKENMLEDLEAGLLEYECYDLKLKGLSNKTTLVLSNTRELDRVPSIKQSTLYTTTHGPC